MSNMKKETLILLAIFCLINIITWILNTQNIATEKVDYLIVIFSNFLLFLLTGISFFVHQKTIQNNNPHVFLRGVMSMTVLKLFVIAIAVVIYCLIEKTPKRIPSIIIGMGLYLLYTTIEVASAYKLNSKNGKN